jgi:hypothetical protein
MVFCRDNLIKSAVSGGRLGDYVGTPVYTCSKSQYKKNMKSNFYYVIYDDERSSGRTLVRKNKVVGYVDVYGDIDLLKEDQQWTYIKNELKKPTSFFDSVFENDKMKSKNETKKKQGKKMENDFKIETNIDVDEILKSVYAPLEVEDIIIEGLGEG